MKLETGPRMDETRRLDAVYRLHHQDVFRTCMKFAGGDREWAMDRCQEVFVILAERLPKLDARAEFGGWLYRVGVNACLMALRRERGWRKMAAILMGQDGTSPRSPERDTRAQRDVAELERALRELPPKQCALMILMHFDGKTQTEAAQILGMSKGNASKLERRAVAALRRQNWEVATGG